MVILVILLLHLLLEMASSKNAANQAQVLVKFVVTNDRTNALYLDNVNLTNASAISKNHKNLISFDVYPNAAINNTTVKINATSKQNATINLYTILGELVYSKTLDLEFGINETSLNTQLISPEIYNLSLLSENGLVRKTLTVVK